MKVSLQAGIAASLFAILGCASPAQADYYNYDTAFYGGYYPGYHSDGSVPVISNIVSYYAKPGEAAPQSDLPGHNWIIPTRYADVAINEFKQGDQRSYLLAMNGQPVLNIDNQSQTLRVSRVQQLNGEDAIIISAQNAQPGCTTRHYLFVVSPNGPLLRELGSCAASYDANVSRGALFVTFAEPGYSIHKMWRYEAAQLLQM